jgi:protoporphyrinogen oxidase
LKKVLVVGGGCAGLTAAYTLNKAGYDVTVLEADLIVGGRMSVFEKDGYMVDEKAQFVHPGYKIAREMLKELGLFDTLHDFDLGGGMHVWFQGHWVSAFPKPDDAKAVALNKEWMDYMGQENFGRFVGFIEKYCKGKFYEGSVDWMMDLDTDDGSNFGEFVKKNFGERILECFVQPVVASLGLEYPEKCGIAFGLQIVWTVLVGGAAVIQKGLGQLAERMAAPLGDRVKLGTPAKEIVIKNGKVTGVMTEQGVFYPAEDVVCAAPATVALKIMPNLPEVMKKAMSKVTYCPTIHVTLFMDKKLTDDVLVGGLLPRSEGQPFCTILFQSSRNPWMLPNKDSDSVSVFFYGDPLPKYWGKSDDKICDAVLAILLRYYPDMPDHYVFGHVVRCELANYTMHNGCASAIKDLRDHHYQDVKGLYLAADYMYTGSYESALAAGRKAAMVVMGEIDSI